MWLRTLAVTSTITLLCPLAMADDVAVDASALEDVTYANQISRMIQEKCQACHRPDAIGPFTLMNYRQVKGWSKMIREVVETKRMPPWHADAPYGHFQNDRRLTPTQKAQLIHWIDNGMPRGDVADMPEPVDYSAHGQWQFGKPDLIFVQPEEVEVDATGVVPYLNFQQETNFDRDMYIRASEAKPGNPAVVHHMIVTWILPEGRNPNWKGPRMGAVAGQAPGDIPFDARPGTARIVPAGSILNWQMHYTPTGKQEVDQSSIGIWFDDAPPEYVVHTGRAWNLDLKIPAHAERYHIEAKDTLEHDRYILSYMPHMHLRGTSFKYTAIYPDGRKEVLLDVPDYDFSWQSNYVEQEPKLLPAGTTLHCEAYFDNSANNPYNPDPNKPVTWGDQTWEEMMIGWYDYYSPSKGANYGGKATD